MSRNKKSYELTPVKYLEVEEQELLKNTLRRYGVTNPRDTTLIWVAYVTGARASEVLDIRVGDLFPDRSSVLIRGKKGSRDRVMRMPEWLMLRVLSLGSCVDTGRVFPISYQRFYQIWCEYRPVGKRLHSLRHTFAMNVYRGGRDLHMVQACLGHRSFSNTLIYAQYQSRQEDMERALGYLGVGES